MTQPLAFVIDDDIKLGELYTQALELAGFTAVHIADSTKAHEMMVEQQPDVVMLDMQMPILGGGEVLQAIRDDTRTAHIKVMVASANHMTLDENIGEMAQLVLQKPVSLEQIQHFAQRLLTL